VGGEPGCGGVVVEVVVAGKGGRGRSSDWVFLARVCDGNRFRGSWS
jgi:hypothetical protein